MNDICVVDLGWGDAGKGGTIDWLARHVERPLIVRYTGASQALHHVVRAVDNRSHGFAQIGSGTLAGAPTHLGRHMLVNPLNWHRERIGLMNEFGMTPGRDYEVSVDPGCLVITPYHMIANRMRELARGDRRHGSCGQGVGEAVAHANVLPEQALHVRDLASSPKVGKTLSRQREWARSEIEAMCGGVLPGGDAGQAQWAMFESAERQHGNWIDGYVAFRQLVKVIADEWIGSWQGTVIYEGAQGILLDETHGLEPPHVTWSKTTAVHAVETAAAANRPRPEVWGVTRCYQTRHGAGPFPTENAALAYQLPELHNGYGQWQGDWRVGRLDLGALRHALAVSMAVNADVDRLVVNHLDRLGPTESIVCDREHWTEPVTYDQYPEEPADFAHGLAAALDLPLALLSYGPSANQKIIPSRLTTA